LFILEYASLFNRNLEKMKENYVWQEDFFGESMGDCRRLVFKNISSVYDSYMNVCIWTWKFTECQSINPLYNPALQSDIVVRRYKTFTEPIMQLKMLIQAIRIK